MKQSISELFHLSEKQFEQIYQQVLEPELQELESQRKRMHFKRYALWLTGAIIAIVAFVLLVRPDIGIIAILIMLVIPLWALIIFIFSEIYVFRYKQEYKEKLISLILKHVNADLKYTTRPDISVQYLRDTGLINQRFTSLHKQDGISGTLNGVDIGVAEISASIGSGKNRRPVFRGLFCEANYEEKFRGWAVICPEAQFAKFHRLQGKLFESIGITKFDSIDKLEAIDTQFESVFDVYGSSAEDVNAILTPNLIQKLLDLYNEKNAEISLTAKGRTVYVAVRSRYNYLESPVNVPATDRKIIHNMLSDLAMMLSIIEDLNVAYI